MIKSGSGLKGRKSQAAFPRQTIFHLRASSSPQLVYRYSSWHCESQHWIEASRIWGCQSGVAGEHGYWTGYRKGTLHAGKVCGGVYKSCLGFKVNTDTTSLHIQILNEGKHSVSQCWECANSPNLLFNHNHGILFWPGLWDYLWLIRSSQFLSPLCFLFVHGCSKEDVLCSHHEFALRKHRLSLALLRVNDHKASELWYIHQQLCPNT